MAIRSQSTTPFKEGQNTIARGKDAPKVKVYSNASKGKSADPSGTSDILKTALATRTPTLPSDNHIWTHTTRVEPVGVNYASHVTGEFGSVARKGKGQGVYSYGGAPNKKGDNAVGSNSNRKGDNPLGKAMNKVGTNAMGKNSGRKGSNSIGSNSNRTGSKSGYPKFSPRGGGKNV
jgi:hypothetical protein